MLAAGLSVILDATFVSKSDRLAGRTLADRAGAEFMVIECRADEATIRKWLSERLLKGSASDGRVELLEPQLRQFEPVTEDPDSRHIVVDSSKPADVNVRQVLKVMVED